MKNGKEIRKVSVYRDMDSSLVQKDNKILNQGVVANLKGFCTTSNILYELNEEDNVGQLEERKRRRSETLDLGKMDVDMGQKIDGPHSRQYQTDTVISVRDSAVSSNNELVELAMQAIHPQ